jgi:predicted nucleic acid-binding protein
MIVVDTSVWISASRRPASADAEALKQLLDIDEVTLAWPVRVELLSGTSRNSRKAFRRALSALPVALPTEETLRIVEQWVPLAADAGYRFSVPDLIIAALAHELTALTWSLDEDFVEMEKLGFVQLYA